MAAEKSSEEPNIAVPAMAGFVGVGVGALGFGAGYGARAYYNTAAYKDLVEKFPELPTAEAEALATTGARRAFLGGTALCGLMGLGAVMTARAYGIKSAADFGEEIKKWLPTQDRLEVRAQPFFGHPGGAPAARPCSTGGRARGVRQAVVVPKIAPLQRTVTEHLQGARDAAGGSFATSELGRKMSERAVGSVKEQKLEVGARGANTAAHAPLLAPSLSRLSLTPAHAVPRRLASLAPSSRVAISLPPTQPWEKEVIATLEGKPAPPK
jgi:hypothetical protein